MPDTGPNYHPTINFVDDFITSCPDVTFRKTLLLLASGLEIEGRAISCHVLFGKPPSLNNMIRVNRLSDAYINILEKEFDNDGDAREKYTENGRVNQHFLKELSATSRSAKLLCHFHGTPSKLLGLYLVPYFMNLRQVATDDRVVVSVEPPRCLWVYQGGKLEQQVIQLRGSGDWVVRNVQKVLDQSPINMLARMQVSGDCLGPARLLLETLYMASQQVHGISIAVLPGDHSGMSVLKPNKSKTVDMSVSTPDRLLRFCEWDGMTVVQPKNGGLHVLASGVYLDGPGGRHDSSSKLSASLDNGFVVVVSQDGPVSWYVKGKKILIEDKTRYQIW
ncbi:MAG: hypothetical protein HW380_468 [Magnetococcales bacterium]|nr:hypothetical protein [Magnetococcales bacterium]